MKRSLMKPQRVSFNLVDMLSKHSMVLPHTSRKPSTWKPPAIVSKPQSKFVLVAHNLEVIVSYVVF